MSVPAPVPAESQASDIAVVISSRNEADRIQATVTAATGLAGVGLVVVVDDGSTDGTGAVARRAGAVVLKHARNRGESAAQAGPLADPVLAGTADMTIAIFAATVKLGGHGLVVGLSGAGICRAVGWRPVQPLNGQRCLTRAAFEAARPLARGWGVETALTIDLLRQGFRVTEVEVELAHRSTGTGLRAQLHRAHQLADVARALAVRR